VRILVVEDGLKLAGLLRRGLEEEGYAVDVVGTGADALWAGTENPYDAIVLDVMLPDIDGFAVCRRLRDGRRSSYSRPGMPWSIVSRASTRVPTTT
jgi:two-component system OmpR family response regulator